MYTTDASAMSYILSHQDEFVKPTDIKIALTLLGEGAGLSDRVPSPNYATPSILTFPALGLVFAEGHTHRKQVCWSPTI